MKLQEFQAKRILGQYGVACPKGRVAITAEEAEAAAREIDARRFVVKAQILAGDRARSGGIHFVDTPEAVQTVAAQLLGQRLVTSQTGPKGQIVRRVLVEEAVPNAQELYLTITVDSSSGGLALIGSAAGGSDVEVRQRQDKAKLETLFLNTGGKFPDRDVAAFCGRLGLAEGQLQACVEIVRRVHLATVELDANLIELNPLVLSDAGKFVILDAKILLDDNALFRHPDLAELRDDDELDEVELEAQRHQVNFMQMDGDIGIVVNGAGLALATVDMVCEAGGRPANFMDIRTTAKSLDIAQGISLVLDNPSAKVLLVNVYGGGMQACDTIVEGLAIAVRRKGRVLPTVLRLAGNNEDLARLRLDSFNLPIVECSNMLDAVNRAIAIAGGRVS